MNDEFDDFTEEEGAPGPFVGEEDTGTVSAEIAKLTQELEQKAREAAEANDKYLRTSADFDNYRKRMQRDLADFRKYANEQMARELLSVVDHLALAIKHAAEAGESKDGLRQGVELVYKQLHDVLEKFGITSFESQGEPFDPAKHDAIMQEETDAVPENTVVQVFQEGYLYHDKVLRHARVGVSKKPAGNRKDNEEDQGNEQ
jgi:molecular chaperone GrpE